VEMLGCVARFPEIQPKRLTRAAGFFGKQYLSLKQFHDSPVESSPSRGMNTQKQKNKKHVESNQNLASIICLFQTQTKKQNKTQNKF